MLTEVAALEQKHDEPNRRWFTDEKLDLYVWYDHDHNPVRFQLCFNKGGNEQALNWNRESGLSSYAVDDGEGGIYRMKSSPVLVAGGESDVRTLRRDFIDSGRDLEQDLYQFVLSRIPDS